MASTLTASDREMDRQRWWEIHDPDEYVCPDCGRTNDHPEFSKWNVHHVDKQPGKVVALRQICHKVRHGSKRKDVSLEGWKDAFLAIGSES